MIAQRLEDRDLLAEINADFLGQCGPLLSGENLRKALGYNTLEDLREAEENGTLPVPMFPIEGRSGTFAYSWDVACWLIRVGQNRSVPIAS